MSAYFSLPNIGKIAVLLFMVCFTACHSPTSDLKMIYGDDDRESIENVTDELFVKMKDSIGVIVTNYNSSSSIFSSDFAFDSKQTLEKSLEFMHRVPTCDSVRFRNEPNPGSCSGFLVTPNVFMTAGHCVHRIETMNISFNFDSKKANSGKIKSNELYRPVKILAKEFTREGDDFALLQLDRPVEGVTPFQLERTPDLEVGMALAVLGHPLGLPLKVTKNGKATVINESIISGQIDTYKGNSGSVVVNQNTGAPVGILVSQSGLVNSFYYEPKKACMAETVLDPDKVGVIENSTRIDYVLSIIDPQLAKDIVANRTLPSVTNLKPPLRSGVLLELSGTYFLNKEYEDKLGTTVEESPPFDQTYLPITEYSNSFVAAQLILKTLSDEYQTIIVKHMGTYEIKYVEVEIMNGPQKGEVRFWHPIEFDNAVWANVQIVSGKRLLSPVFKVLDSELTKYFGGKLDRLKYKYETVRGSSSWVLNENNELKYSRKYCEVVLLEDNTYNIEMLHEFGNQNKRFAKVKFLNCGREGSEEYLEL